MRAVVFMTSPWYTIARRLPPTSPVITGPACRAARSRGTAPNSRSNLAVDRASARSTAKKEAGGAGPRAPSRHRPGDHHFVADVLIDLALVLLDRIGGEPKDFA